MRKLSILALVLCLSGCLQGLEKKDSGNVESIQTSEAAVSDDQEEEASAEQIVIKSPNQVEASVSCQENHCPPPPPFSKYVDIEYDENNCQLTCGDIISADIKERALVLKTTGLNKSQDSFEFKVQDPDYPNVHFHHKKISQNGVDISTKVVASRDLEIEIVHLSAGLQCRVQRNVSTDKEAYVVNEVDIHCTKNISALSINPFLSVGSIVSLPNPTSYSSSDHKIEPAPFCEPIYCPMGFRSPREGEICKMVQPKRDRNGCDLGCPIQVCEDIKEEVPLCPEVLCAKPKRPTPPPGYKYVCEESFSIDHNKCVSCPKLDCKLVKVRPVICPAIACSMIDCKPGFKAIKVKKEIDRDSEECPSCDEYKCVPIKPICQCAAPPLGCKYVNTGSSCCGTLVCEEGPGLPQDGDDPDIPICEYPYPLGEEILDASSSHLPDGR